MEYIKRTLTDLRQGVCDATKGGRLPSPGPTHQEAVKSLADRSFMSGAHYRRQQLRASRDGAHPDVVKFANKLIKAAAEYNIPLWPHQYARDRATQERLFREGRTKARFGQSPHNYGLAVDIIHGTRAWDLNKKEWAMIGVLGNEVSRRMNVKFDWGGDWGFYDPAHWQLGGWRGHTDRDHWPK